LKTGKELHLSLEEELAEVSLVIANQRAHIEEMHELIIDWNLLMHTRFPFTWNNDPSGLLIQERIRELGIGKERAKP